jgi:hypothetical protein
VPINRHQLKGGRVQRITRVFSALVFVLTPLLGACGGGAATPRPLGPVPLEAQLFYDNGTAIRDSLTVVIRDVEGLRRYWADATRTQSSPPQVPQVDFGRQMVLLVAGGRMPQEFQIRIDSAGVRNEPTADRKQRDVLVVNYTVTESCRRSGREGYPVELVRIRKYEGDVRFTGRREPAANCRN